MTKIRVALFLFVIIHISQPPLLISQIAKFGHLSVDQGLSQNSVGSIVQDYNGFMWFATADGLNRYDGYTFRIFKNDPKDTNSIYSNNIHCLYLDKDSILWLGFNNGRIDCFNSKTNHFTHFYLPPQNGKTENVSSVMCITENKLKQLFIATSDDGIFILNKQTGKWLNFRNDKNNANTLPGNNISKIIFDKQGVLWCATWGNGAVSWNPSTLKFTQYTNLNSLNLQTIYSDVILHAF
ncbi:MAG: hypothetical protein K8R85_03210 [Bacteroidetes bacterium]|nr:hypothetical protein [Bacteroidota bacterium]